MSSEIVIVVPSYQGAWRVERLLESVTLYDPDALRFARWLVVEDRSDDEHALAYEKLTYRYPIDLEHLPSWSNMHGAAQRAFEIAYKEYSPSWIIYLGDDVLVTPHAISNMLQFLRNEIPSVGLVQFPYWNAIDLTSEKDEYAGPVLLHSKEDMYSSDPSWLTRVPRNPHWDAHPWAYPYINVNGVGFACKVPHFFNVGGFASKTWCLDESISVRTWLHSSLSIVALPGPPLIHFFGGVRFAGAPDHDAWTMSAWIDAMGMSKSQAGTLSAQKLEERKAQVLEETQRAIYFNGHPEPVRS